MAGGNALSVYIILVYHFTVSALPASKNFTTVKLIPPSSQLNDVGQGKLTQRADIGVKANQRSAFLGNKADAFRLHRPGFEHVPGSVSFESSANTGLYLRYKNYRFHLEKMKPSGVFEKDATFIERKTQTRGAAAYELFNHPGWFMCHDINSPFGLVAKKAEIESHEFLIGCLYMAVAQKPTKNDLQERLKLDTVQKNENNMEKAVVRNSTGIITNDVLAANVVKGNGGQATQSSAETNQMLQNKIYDHLQPNKAINATKTKDASSSNSTEGNGGSNPKLLDALLANKANQTNTAKQLDSTKLSNATNGFHDKEKNVPASNSSQDLRKPKLDMQNKLNPPNSKGDKQTYSGGNKNVQYLPGSSVRNQSNFTSMKPKGEYASNTQTGLQKNSSLQQQAQSMMNDNVPNAKQSAQQALINGPSINGQNASFVKEKDGNGKVVSQEKQIPANYGPPQQNDQHGKQFTMHLTIPAGVNQGSSFTFQQNGTLPGGQGKQSLQSNIAQITTKALGFLHSALRHQHQGAHQFANDRPRPPFAQLQRQQQRFQGPMNYFNQPSRPQNMFQTPTNKFAPAPLASGGPLNNAFADRRPQVPFAFKTYEGVGKQLEMGKPYNYQYPGNTWKGMVSVSKQSLLGTSAKPHEQVTNKTAEQRDKCISLKFLNKIRKPIKLVSSMKPEGYLITAETFKLRTIFKHPRKHHHVIFYARDADDRDNEVLLNNNNAIAVTPGGCDLPFRSVLLSHHGQIVNKEVERLREEDEYNASIDAARKAIVVGEKENFNQWTSFSSCSATCGRSLQTRRRSCKPGKICKGKSVEIRTCIQTPCPVATCVKTYSGKCCALPFVYRGAVVNRCLVDPQSHHSWCAITPNFDKEKRWGYCQPSGPRTEKMAAVIRSFLPVPPNSLQMQTTPCPQGCSEVCMAWCQRSCCAANANV